MLITLTGSSKAGKTETALSFAAALASENKLVLLINANLHFDILGLRLSKKMDKDFTNLLTKENNDLNVREYIVKSEIENLYLLSISAKERRLEEPVVIKEMAERLFFELENMYDYIICDGVDFKDPLTIYCLSKADIIFNMQTLNIKSLVESPIYERLISLIIKEGAKAYNICSRHSEALAISDYENAAGIKFSFEIPFVVHNREYEHQGQIYYLPKKRDVRKYKKAVAGILDYIRKG